MSIQRNTLVAPFSVNSPLTEKNSKGQPTGTLTVTHQRWFGQVATAINGSAQVTATIPANSTAQGQPGTIAFDSNWVYVCVGLNEWRRAALNTF